MKSNSSQPPLLQRGGDKKKVLVAKKHPLSRSKRRSLPKGESKKVLVALSGGIDSAVSAYLLKKQGFKVEAAFMKNWSSTAGLKIQDCPWLEDRREALRVAAFLEIPLHTLDFEKEYEKKVMKYFFSEYKAGRTPNPDVMCNKEIKFKLLYNWAMQNGFDFLATGHYAKAVDSGQWTVDRKKIDYRLSTNHYSLVRSTDEFKDQTYFIYNIKPEQLAHLLFPIGAMKKSEVRNLAKKIKLPNAERKESMGLCFVGKVRLKEFLGQKLKPKKGEIVFVPPILSLRTNPASSSQGGSKQSNLKKGIATSARQSSGLLAMTSKILGQHEGLHNYTIGQRHGIKVGGSGPFYVFKKDLATNTLYVTSDPKDQRLFVKEVQLHSVNWIAPSYKLSATHPTSSGQESYQLAGRYRHQGELVPLSIKRIKKDPSWPATRAEADLYQVVFKYPQKAVASGQSLVLYKGKECVGGGVIV